MQAARSADESPGIILVRTGPDGVDEARTGTRRQEIAEAADSEEPGGRKDSERIRADCCEECLIRAIPRWPQTADLVISLASVASFQQSVRLDMRQMHFGQRSPRKRRKGSANIPYL